MLLEHKVPSLMRELHGVTNTTTTTTTTTNGEINNVVKKTIPKNELINRNGLVNGIH